MDEALDTPGLAAASLALSALPFSGAFLTRIDSLLLFDLLQAPQQGVDLHLDLSQLPFDGLQLVGLHWDTQTHQIRATVPLPTAKILTFSESSETPPATVPGCGPTAPNFQISSQLPPAVACGAAPERHLRTDSICEAAGVYFLSASQAEFGSCGRD